MKWSDLEKSLNHMSAPHVAGNLGLAYERKLQYADALQHHQKSYELLSRPGAVAQQYYITRAKSDVARVDALVESEHGAYQ